MMGCNARWKIWLGGNYLAHAAIITLQTLCNDFKNQLLDCFPDFVVEIGCSQKKEH